MTDRELMQQALDALEKIGMGGDPRWADDVAPILRARLAQPELGVTLTVAKHPVSLRKPSEYKLSKESLEDVVLEREWQGLTDEEKLTIVRETDNPVDALAATEAKLKEKNT